MFSLVFILVFYIMALGHNYSSGADTSLTGEPRNEDSAVLSEKSMAEAFLVGSPMQGLGSDIVDIANEYEVSWRIIIGIARAESSLGRAFVYEYDHNCHNYWGIKPPGGRRDDGSYLRCYYTDENGITSIAALLSRRYKDQTPEEMCGIYVVPCNENWLGTINEYFIN